MSDDTATTPTMAGAATASTRQAKLQPHQVLFFNRQLASMARLNMPLAKGVKILAREVDEESFRVVLEGVQRDLEEGVPLSTALAKYPESFSRLYLEVLKSGEASGNLAGILEELSTYSETMARIKSQIISALLYPAIIFLGMGGFVLFFLTYLTPIIKKMIEDQKAMVDATAAARMDDAIPFYSKWVFGASDLFLSPLFSIPFALAILLAIGWAVNTLIKMGDSYDDVLFRLPLFGKLFQRATLMKLTRTMRELLLNGVSMVNTLRLATNVVGDNRFKTKLQEVTTAVEEGGSFSKNLASGDIFPDTMVWKLQMAEEKGIVEDALKELSREFEAEVENLTVFVTKVLSPALLIVTFVVLLILVAATFVPLTKLHQFIS